MKNIFWTGEESWGRCLNRPAVEYGLYEQPEHNVNGTSGIVWKRICQKTERWFGPKKSRTKLATEAMKVVIHALSITFMLDGVALHSQLIYSAFNIAK